MISPWLPDDFEHPLRVELPGGVHLRPISPNDTEIDMPAVTGNQAMLWAKYGQAWGWPPADMSAEADREDLDRHAREMITHESFNYAILPADEAALYGCIYIDPPEGEGADAPAEPAADVSFWVTADAPAGLEQSVREFVPVWLARSWPFVAVRYPFGEVG